MITNSPSANPKKPTTIWGKLRSFIAAEKNSLTAFLISFIAGAMFLVIGFADRLYAINTTERELFSVRIWALILFVAYIFITYVVCFLRGLKTWQALSVWIQSNLLMFIALVFMFRLNNQSLELFGITLSTGLVFIPLTILIFLVNNSLLTKFKLSMTLVASQVLLFFVQAFSLINFLVDNKVSSLAFRDPIVEYILNLPVFVWLVICAAAVSVASVFSFTIPGRFSTQRRLIVGAGFFALIFPFLLLINSFSLDSYWYKTLAMLVFWDFLFTPFQIIFEEKIDPQFKAKIRISALYHIALILFIVLWYFMGINPANV